MSELVSNRSGVLEIEGVSAETLANRFGTPLYVYSAQTIRRRYQALESAFKKREVLLCYALKANSNSTVCSVLVEQGAGADIVSIGELTRALRAGFTPDKIVFSGVGKTDEEMVAGLRAGLLTFNIESSEELDALSRVAARLKIRAPISIRLNPDVNAGTHPHITTGRAENKFGVDTNEAMALYKRAVVDPWLHVKGIQCHIGSQITTVGPYRRAAQSVAKVIKRLEAMGIRLSQVDMGGGIGIQYKNEKTVSLPTLAEEIIKTFSPWPDLRLMLEPGRYLVAEAGLLLTRVIYRKKTSKRMFIIVDGAMTDLPRPALYDAWHPIEPVRPRRGAKALVDVVGPVCESADFLARGRKLPPLERGDVLAVGKAGAYGFAMSSQYNSRPRAAEILIDKGETRLVRQRETMEDLIQGEA